jgi:hypothetical protein
LNAPIAKSNTGRLRRRYGAVCAALLMVLRLNNESMAARDVRPQQQISA